MLLGNGSGGFSAPNSTFLALDYRYYRGGGRPERRSLRGLRDVALFRVRHRAAGHSSGFLQGPNGFFSTGGNSSDVAAGDLDNDGDNDLVAANFYGNSVGVLLGDGLGGFSGPVNYATGGGNRSSLVLGDFTHDGNLDVAAANFSTHQVAVLYGGGNGAFSTPVLSAVGAFPLGIVAGDFNDDGWLDAATTNSGSGTVSVLINDQTWPAPPPSVRIEDATVTEGHTGTVTAGFVSHPVQRSRRAGDRPLHHGGRLGHDGRRRLSERQRHVDLSTPAVRSRRRSRSRSTATAAANRMRPSSSTSRAPQPRSPTPRARGRSSTTSRR